MNTGHKNITNRISNGVKILIVYATAGAGHKRAAEAIYQQARRNNLDVKIINILDYSNPVFKYLYSYGYILLIKYFPSIWKIFFYLTDNPRNTIPKVFFRFINRLNTLPYSRFLQDERFDVIVSTQFMSTAMTVHIKKKQNVRLVSVVTDFSVHGFWYNQLVDKYTVAAEKAKKELISFGARPGDINITGIPVDTRFSNIYNRREISKKLGVASETFSILVMTGAIGIGPIKEIVDVLRDDAQLLVVCGSNKKLYQQLEAMQLGNLKIFGLVDNVYELMSVSDLIITKPGGMTISEALTENLPMIFFSIIPGQETNNAKTIVKYEAGLILEDVDKIRQAILEFKNNKHRLEQYRRNAGSLAHPDAAKDILDIALKQ